MRDPRLAFRRTVILSLGLPLIAALSWIGVVFIENDNFRVTSADLFRSGQLRTAEWNESLETARYRSVLNLRGAKPKSDWYQNEITFAAEHGLDHHDYELSAEAAPTVTQMRDIVDMMRQAPKPLLVHCKNGSDRSGLAAALYVLAVEGRPVAEARHQLSLWYGHFPWLGSRTSAMDAAFETYVSARSAEAATPRNPPAKPL